MTRPAAFAALACALLLATACSNSTLKIENEPALIQGERFNSSEDTKLAAIDAILATPALRESLGESPTIERNLSNSVMSSGRPFGRVRSTEMETVRIVANDQSVVVNLTVQSKGSGEWGLAEWNLVESSDEPLATD